MNAAATPEQAEVGRKYLIANRKRLVEVLTVTDGAVVYEWLDGPPLVAKHKDDPKPQHFYTMKREAFEAEATTYGVKQ